MTKDLPINKLIWEAAIEVTKGMYEHGVRIRERHAAKYSEDLHSVSTDVIYETEDGESKRIRIHVSITEPYGDGPGYCKECRVELEPLPVGNAFLLRMFILGLCFGCSSWQRKVNAGMQPDESSYVLITPDFNYYTFEIPVTDPKVNRNTLGHGGQWFYAETDKHKLASNNVIHGGIVPEHFRDRLPSNGRMTTDPPEWFTIWYAEAMEIESRPND